MEKTVRSCGGVKPDTQDDVKSPVQIEAEQAQERVDDEEKGANEFSTPGGKQTIPVINESGLYSLVLGYSNTKDALGRHVDPEDKRESCFPTPSGEQEMTVISESNN